MLSEACPICEMPGCRRERYAVTILADKIGPDTVLIHAVDKEDAAIFGLGLVDLTGGVLVSVQYRGGGA